MRLWRDAASESGPEIWPRRRHALSQAALYRLWPSARRTDELIRFESDLPHLDLSLRSTARRVRATAAGCSRYSSSPAAWSLGRSCTTAGMSVACDIAPKPPDIAHRGGGSPCS